MKINFDIIDREFFNVNEHIVHGMLCYLVTPKHIGIPWDNNNLHYRSSLWDLSGNPVSLSFNKFFNAGEKPDVSPMPDNLTNACVVSKIDGSTLIVSRFNDQVITRIRSTSTVSGLDYGFEVDVLKEKYPLAFNPPIGVSWLFEWVSDNQKIVISYPNCPDIKLIGGINHEDYSLMIQSELDVLGKQIGVDRPKYYSFSSIDEMKRVVEQFKDEEGVCLYSKNGQQIHKIKAETYLRLHRMKSELSSIEKMINVWISRGCPTYNDFYNYIMTTFDYELAEYCRGNISNVCDAYKEVNKITGHMKSFVEPLKLVARKEAALKIISAYGKTSRGGFAFKMLDNKELEGDDIKLLIFQVLKK